MEPEAQQKTSIASKNHPADLVLLSEAQLDKVVAGESRPQRPRARAQPRFFDFTDEPLIVTPLGPDEPASRSGIIPKKVGMTRLFLAVGRQVGVSDLFSSARGPRGH
jgi:hypothetical protein